MNPIQQAIEALSIAVRQNSHDMLMTGEELRQCESALTSLRSLQKEVEGVELPELPEPAVFDGAAHPLYDKAEHYSADQMHTYARTAVAAALGRGVVPQDEPCFCDLTYPDADPNESCGDCPKRDYKATKPTQAERAVTQREHGVLMAAARRSGKVIVQPTQAEAPSEREALPPPDFFVDGGATPCWYESSVRAALATQQAVQGEPVAWMYRVSPGPWELTFDKGTITGAHRVIALGVVKDYFEVAATPPTPGQVERDGSKLLAEEPTWDMILAGWDYAGSDNNARATWIAMHRAARSSEGGGNEHSR